MNTRLEIQDFPLWEKMKNKRLLSSFDLELTARCNLNCRHCYINLLAGDQAARKSELSLAEIGQIADQAVEMGAMWCLLTGGEPLLREDFADVYMLLKRKGLLVSVFTNATTIRPDHIALFKKYPPRDIEVTIYGASRQTYEVVTCTPGSYTRFVRGLDALFEAGVRVRLKAMALRSNLEDMEAIATFGRLRTKDFYRFDPVLHLRYDGNQQRNAEIKQERLTPEEIVRLERLDAARFGALQKNCDELINQDLTHFGCDHLFHCGAGEGSFNVGYDGTFRLCSSLWAPGTTVNLRETPLRQAWETLIPQVRDLRSQDAEFLNTCRKCAIVNLCLHCPAHAYLETGSQIDVRPVRDFDAFIGKEMDFRVVKVNHPSENVVVSHKVLVEEELAGQRKTILESLEKGQILEGHVKAITDFGVFVDLGGVDGLVHITDLSWGRISHPSEVVKLDQTVNIVVLDFDQEKKRISLGMKQLLPHPWENIELKYPVGTKVQGKVVSLTDYGAFVEIEKGIEGLIHISEMSWTQHIKHPSQMVSMGQIVNAVILSLDKDGKKISLGMKQLEPDPWLTLLQKYPVGSKHLGVVRNLTNFGVFVELEEGVDGLVHISDLSWTKKIRHPGEVVKKGDKIEVVILGIDVDQRRISLGHKQIQDNPWEAFETTYKVGTPVEGKIVRIIEKGVIVELPLGVDGFVPLSQLSQTPVKNISESFHVDNVLPLQVIEFDKDNKKIVLSVIEFLRGKEQKILDDYVSSHKLSPMTLKDVMTVSGVMTEHSANEPSNA